MSLQSVHRKLENLRKRMQAAAEAMDFEEAARLRNEIEHWSNRGPAEASGGEDIAPDSTVSQPPPGAMGLGTHMPVAEPPKGWVKPKKPDPLTSNVKGRRR